MLGTGSSEPFAVHQLARHGKVDETCSASIQSCPVISLDLEHRSGSRREMFMRPSAVAALVPIGQGACQSTETWLMANKHDRAYLGLNLLQTFQHLTRRGVVEPGINLRIGQVWDRVHHA